jgi:hypothetical protein
MPAPANLWSSALQQGDYEAAWGMSAQRLERLDSATRDDPTTPYHRRWVWDGTPFEHRNVLVRCYHGLGDTIQFLRYLPLLRRTAASVTLEAQPALIPLLADFPGVDRLIPFDPACPAPAGECAVEIMELFFALRVPPERAPHAYLSAAPAPLPAGTIGLCWQAGDWDRERSVPESLLRGFTRWPCLSLVTAPTALDVLNPRGCPMDMLQTARLVAGTDLVVTVDTMIAHLAGALAKPVLLLLKRDCDWRWAGGGSRSAWYPSMRIHRQQRPAEWPAVIARALAGVPEFMGGP